MVKHINRCVICGSYTLEDKCKCGGKVLSPKPPKFSLEDKYSGLRREVKKKELKEKGLL